MGLFAHMKFIQATLKRKRKRLVLPCAAMALKNKFHTIGIPFSKVDPMLNVPPLMVVFKSGKTPFADLQL